MLLRSVTEHIRQQNWFAVFVDFVIVVVGVVVGLQAQEWSTARAERRAEHDAVGRLIVEYQQNLDLLEAGREKTRKAMMATESLLAMMSADAHPVVMDDALAQTFIDCLSNPKLVPMLGTTSSLMASGDLRLISDAEIQKMLAQWSVAAQELIEWQEIERHHGEELIFGATLDYIAWPTLLSRIDSSWRESALESDLRGLFSSTRFEGLLTNRRYNKRNSIDRIDKLEADTEKLIERLEARLTELTL